MAQCVDFKYLLNSSDKELTMALKRKFKLRRDFQYMNSNENIITCRISRYDLIKLFMYWFDGEIMSDDYILRFLKYNTNFNNKVIFQVIKNRVSLENKYISHMKYISTEEIIDEKYDSIVNFTISTNEIIRLLTDRC